MYLPLSGKTNSGRWKISKKKGVNDMSDRLIREFITRTVLIRTKLHPQDTTENNKTTRTSR